MRTAQPSTAARPRCRLSACRLRTTAAVAVESAPANAGLEQLRFLAPADALAVAAAVGTPAYVYDAATLRRQALAALAFPNAYGLTVRYALKSSPNAAILQLFTRLGLKMDASSGYEVHRAVKAGVPAANISLSSQELPPFFADLLRMGMEVNACRRACSPALEPRPSQPRQPAPAGLHRRRLPRRGGGAALQPRPGQRRHWQDQRWRAGQQARSATPAPAPPDAAPASASGTSWCRRCRRWWRSTS